MKVSNAKELMAEALNLEGIGEGGLKDYIMSTFMQESGGGKNAGKSHANASGLMQVTPGAFNEVADKGWQQGDLLQNARAGIRYAKKMNDNAGGDLWLTAVGYYGGPGAQQAARKGTARFDPKNNDYPSTFEYADQVMGKMGRQDLQRGFTKANRDQQRGNAPMQFSNTTGTSAPTQVATAQQGQPQAATPAPTSPVAASPTLGNPYELLGIAGTEKALGEAVTAQNSWQTFLQKNQDAKQAAAAGTPATGLNSLASAMPVQPAQDIGTSFMASLAKLGGVPEVNMNPYQGFGGLEGIL